ncbi:rh50 [Anaeramoeba flamelloides]|uniref:Rh50 n=1 Tax=Anaeramoeba flamelloides TaxID=1746091 RepID=A0AAV8AE53_9EUKA|nr:rh50 isoform b [Anaeramoeba flamelloides]KAJ6255529.1 rh50 [Anaeramoeba flamelloides]
MGFKKSQIGFVTAIGVFQIAFLILISIWFRYDESFDETKGEEYDLRTEYYYTYYSDVAVMVIIGFGYLMTFLKKYGLSAAGYTFLLAAFCMQWVLINNAFWHQIHEYGELRRYDVTIPSLIEGMFGAAAVMISFGAVLGKTTPFQLILIAFFEIIFYSFNIYVSVFLVNVTDIGGSMIIHTFGAYFGLGLTTMLTSRKTKEHLSNPNNGANDVSDVFSFIGTIFLWLFWPSFNGALGAPGSRFRVIVNTVLSLCCSCVASYIWSILLNNGKFNAVDIQNATLAGGVAVGSSANLYITIVGAMAIGLIAGSLSTIGFNKITPFLEKKFGIHDTCGVHNLHGIPGIIGGAASILVVYCGTQDHSLYNGAFDLLFPEGDDQTMRQLGALCITVPLSFISGLLVGFILRLLTPNAEKPFSDEEFWFDEDNEENENKQNDLRDKPIATIAESNLINSNSSEIENQSQENSEKLSTNHSD